MSTLVPWPVPAERVAMMFDPRAERMADTLTGFLADPDSASLLVVAIERLAPEDRTALKCAIAVAEAIEAAGPPRAT